MNQMMCYTTDIHLLHRSIHCFHCIQIQSQFSVLFVVAVLLQKSCGIYGWCLLINLFFYKINSAHFPCTCKVCNSPASPLLCNLSSSLAPIHLHKLYHLWIPLAALLAVFQLNFSKHLNCLYQKSWTSLISPYTRIFYMFKTAVGVMGNLT